MAPRAQRAQGKEKCAGSRGFSSLIFAGVGIWKSHLGGGKEKPMELLQASSISICLNVFSYGSASSRFLTNYLKKNPFPILRNACILLIP